MCVLAARPRPRGCLRALQRLLATASNGGSAGQKEDDAFDVVFVGAGPGGYVGAIRAAQLGMRTACVERDATLGGTCLNVGCIPSKSLLHNSHLLRVAQTEFAARGISLGSGSATVDLAAMMAAKERSVKTLTAGVAMLFRKYGVTTVRGSARLAGPQALDVDVPGGESRRITAQAIVLATGSRSAPLKGLEVDERVIVTSTGALSLQAVPKTMVVVGGGAIGVELGSVWARLGATVTVVEAAPMLGGRSMDSAVSAAFARILRKQGLTVRLGTTVASAQRTKDGVTLEIEDAKTHKRETLSADVVLVAAGRQPLTDGLGLEDHNVSLDERGFIGVDDTFTTSVPSIRAIGDVIRGPMLAHKAEDEGIAVAEILASVLRGTSKSAPDANAGGAQRIGHVNYGAIPNVVYTHPEVAWVGLTEEQAVEKHGRDAVRTGMFPFAANSRARTVEDSEGFVKVVTEATTDRLLGVHILGSAAGELIAEATLAIEYGASSEDIARTSHAHPTLSEALREACLAAHGLCKPINA